jgi:purine nucleosidase
MKRTLIWVLFVLLVSGGQAYGKQKDLRPLFGKYGIPVYNQGKRGTCSVFAVTGLVEFELAGKAGEYVPLSVEYLNWASNKVTGKFIDGSYFSDAVAAIREYGICRESLLPYSRSGSIGEDDCPLSAVQDAKTRRNIDIVWIKHWDVNNGMSAAQIRQVKANLEKGHPVAIGFRWPKNDKRYRRTENGVMVIPPEEGVFDGHSVIIVGYQDDPDIPGGGCFIFKNSHGEGYGEKGYGRMPYAYAGKYANDGIVLVTEKDGQHGQNFVSLEETFRIERLKPPTGKVRVVLDTDTYNETDDQYALAYAFLSEEKIQLEAVYAAPFKSSKAGSDVGMEKSYQEILHLLKMLGKSPDGFAFRGSDRNLKDISVPVRSEAALDLVKKAMDSTHEDPLYVVAIGCITNVASAILIEPRIVENIVIVWLGGNSLEWPVQNEYNLRQDILASRIILDSGVPLVVMPCRPVVSHLYTTIPELQYYLKDKNELSDYLFSIVEKRSKRGEPWSRIIWDISAVAWLVNPKWIQTDFVHSPVFTDQLTYSVDQSRHLIRMARSLNRDAIFKDLFSKLASYKQ